MKRISIILRVFISAGAACVLAGTAAAQLAEAPAARSSSSAPASRPAASQPAGAVLLSRPPREAPVEPAPARFARGMALLEAGKLVEARAELSAGLFAGEFAGQHEAKAVAALTKLAQQTIFSDKVCDGDPYVFNYAVSAGETLAQILKKSKIGVPSGIIEDINGLTNGLVKAETTLKLIRGPFRAVIAKRTFTMDIFLERPGQGKVFIRRVKVCVGRNDSTPEGAWRVAGKAVHATWNPPPSMAEDVKGPVHWGDKDYPLGKEGYFISLAGIDENTRGLKGFGLHGTNDASSIGHARSHGCIRLGDADIEFAFSVLAEGYSTVETRK